MGLLATVLNMPIIIPPQPSAAVVLGAAMLGRFAHQLSTTLQGKPITTQEEAAEARKSAGELWAVMVDMTQPGTKVDPRSGAEGERERKLLDVKYKIFREAVEVQRRWRGMIAEVDK
jgi:ribulose kinase